MFSNTFRSIDELSTFSNEEFEVVTTILFWTKLKKKNEDPCEVLLLDLSTEVHEGKFATTLLDERDVFFF